MSRTAASRTVFDGTAALKVEPRGSLVLIEGGRAAARPARDSGPERGRLSARQVLAFVLAALAVTVAVVLAGMAGEGRVSLAGEAALTGVGEHVVTVQPGDSLWSIAEEKVTADAPTSTVVSWVMERNGLSSSELTIGQRLVVPGTPLA